MRSTGHIFFRISSGRILLLFFIIRVIHFGKNTTEAKCPFHSILSGVYDFHMTLIWHHIYLDDLAKVVFARFLHSKVTLFLFPYFIFRSRSLKSSILGGGGSIYICDLEFFCKEDLCHPVFVYSVIYTSMDWCIFHILSSNPTQYFYFVAHFCNFDQSCWHLPLSYCFLSTSLLSGTVYIYYALDPSCIFFALVVESAIFLTHWFFFKSRMVFKNQNVGARSLLLRCHHF